MMGLLEYLTILLLATWAISEIAINLFSLRNRSKSVSDRADQLSYWIVWLSTMLPILFAILVWRRAIVAKGSGSFSTLFPLLRTLGCLFLIVGITLRVMAVALLNRQFTTQVLIVEQHRIVDTGIYGIIRHPAYLGHLASLLGIGLVSGNWLSLAVCAALPLAGILYRIHVEESILLRHFGTAYEVYASRTKRLLPGIW
jgi:protein-S-isoprenylcysteine O-methyltransferase Ste14